MSVPFYQRRSADLNPQATVYTYPDGSPAPTGLHPDMTGVNQRPASLYSQVYDDQYRDWGTVGPFTDESIDQHPYLQVSATWTPPPAGPRRDGRDDPLTAGPPRHEPRLLGMFQRATAGNSISRLMDVPGHTFPTTGSQDGASTTWYVDPGVAMAPYTIDPVTGQQPDSLKTVPPSPAHGWTAQPVFNVKATENRKALSELRQQTGNRGDRLAASTYAGQSYSARTAYVANNGSTSVPSRRTRG